MPASTTITIRLATEVKARLEQLALDTRRSRSFLAAEAVHDYLDREQAIIAGVKRGLADVADGRLVSHDAAMGELVEWPEAEPMTTNRYIALIHKEPESDYGVSFPDFPGCVTAGADLNEARGMAEEVLAFHIEGMTEDGATIPEPSTLEAVMSNPVNRDGVAILVAGPAPPVRTVRVNITLPEDVLKDIDDYARSHGFTQSGFLVTAARRAVGR